MTDTTTAITPEERASWRERLENPFSCHDANSAAFTLRLLTALEAAEAAQLLLCQTLADIAVELGCASDNEAMLLAVHEIKERAEQAEAENARLTAQINALLECRKAEKSLASLTRINDGIKGGWIKPWEHEGIPKKLRAARERVKAARQDLEAARRAVAGESEVRE